MWERIFLGALPLAFHGLLSLLYGLIDIAQATASPWIGNLATALTGLYSLSYYPGNVCSPRGANVIPYRLSIKIKTVTERYRVLFLFNTHPNPKLILGDYLFFTCRHIDNVTVWRIAEKIRDR